MSTWNAQTKSYPDVHRPFLHLSQNTQNEYAEMHIVYIPSNIHKNLASRNSLNEMFSKLSAENNMICNENKATLIIISHAWLKSILSQKA